MHVMRMGRPPSCGGMPATPKLMSVSFRYCKKRAQTQTQRMQVAKQRKNIYLACIKLVLIISNRLSLTPAPH